MAGMEAKCMLSSSACIPVIALLFFLVAQISAGIIMSETCHCSLGLLGIFGVEPQMSSDMELYCPCESCKMYDNHFS